MGNVTSTLQNCEEKAQDPTGNAIRSALGRLQNVYTAFALRFVSSDLHTIARLVRCSLSGTYTIDPETFVILGRAIIYAVSPCDAIPDALLLIGFLDDAYVIRLAVNSCSTEIQKFKEWEQRAKNQ